MENEFLHDPAMIHDFLVESEELLQGLDQDMVTLESSPNDDDLLNRVFRALHTIKGTSSFLGFEPLVRLGHKAEDVLNDLRRHEIPLTRRLMDALLASRDQMGKMLADIRAGGLKSYDMDALLNELQEVRSERERPLGEILVSEKATAPEDPQSALSQQAQSPEKKIGDLHVETGAAAKEEANKALLKQKRTGESTADTAQTMRVEVHKLDELINLIGELVLERNRLTRLANDANLGRIAADELNSALSQSTGRLSFITEELQAAGLRARMVPIDTVFRKFPRLVRDVARTLNKEVSLVVRGEDTEIDKTMVELIGDPLVHLIRNSLDHGLEMPDARAAAGKNRQGCIRLEARPEGDQILITVSDDGDGIDPNRVLRKAVEKGLLTAERSRQLSKREVLDLIFLPGFSTAEVVNDLSGRGVGMDVVRSNLKRLNGAIELDSVLGRGTTVSLRLPLTLAILPVLLVEVTGEIYGLPLRSVIETSQIQPSEVHTMEGREVLLSRGKTLPLLRLAHMFQTRQVTSVPCEKVVILSIGEKRLALAVDHLVGQESTVIKPLGTYLHNCTGIAGATISGDGRVRLVLDPAGLLATASGALQAEVVQ